MKVKVDPGAHVPTRAHFTDAGLDLYSKDRGIVPAHGGKVFGTGVHVELPKGCAGLLVSKSGLNTKQGITSTGLIDEGYSGEIMVKLYNHSDEDVFIERHQKISQLVVLQVRYEPVEIAVKIQSGDRGDAGFGSTGG